MEKEREGSQEERIKGEPEGQTERQRPGLGQGQGQGQQEQGPGLPKAQATGKLLEDLLSTAESPVGVGSDRFFGKLPPLLFGEVPAALPSGEAGLWLGALCRLPPGSLGDAHWSAPVAPG